MIKIKQPYSFSEIGKKNNQEDYLFPKTADDSTRVFILCDGMGGHARGEVASQTVADALGDYLTKEKAEGVEVDRGVFNQGLEKAYDALDAIDKGEAKKPGTTMTCLSINDDGCFLAHIGDSRIYQVRPSNFNPEQGDYGILFQTQDHSLVNDLLRAGEITEEEAVNYPQKNVITRAMQPMLDRRYRADIAEISDVKGGDYFFMCCDGILEQLTNERLGAILAEDISDEEKINAIKNLCEGNTRDNFTCWLIPVEETDIKVVAKPKVIEDDSHKIHHHAHNNNDNVIQVDMVGADPWGANQPYSPSPYGEYPGVPKKPVEDKKNWKGMFMIACVALVAFAVVVAVLNLTKSDAPKYTGDGKLPTEKNEKGDKEDKSSDSEPQKIDHESGPKVVRSNAPTIMNTSSGNQQHKPKPVGNAQGGVGNPSVGNSKPSSAANGNKPAGTTPSPGGSKPNSSGISGGGNSGGSVSTGGGSSNPKTANDPTKTKGR